MAEPFLTTREFDSWRDAHDKKVDRLLAAVETHIASAVVTEKQTEHRLTTLETHREHAVIGLGIFTAVISAIVGGITGWLAPR